MRCTAQGRGFCLLSLLATIGSAYSGEGALQRQSLEVSASSHSSTSAGVNASFANLPTVVATLPARFT
jgi:hypothetical protein